MNVKTLVAVIAIFSMSISSALIYIDKEIYSLVITFFSVLVILVLYAFDSTETKP